MSLPTISIITPNYNQGVFLEETICSVLEQNYPKLEYIVIDGGSTDGSVDIIKQYSNDVDYWVSEPDNGQTDAINKGLRRATGEIVAWLNSDDVYLPGTLLAIGEAFSTHQNADIIYGDVENFFDDGSTKISRNNFQLLDFLSRVSIHQPGVFWKRSLHKQYGYLDESFYYLMDYDLWARIFLNCNHQRINRTLTRFRVHDAAKTGQNPPGLYYDYRRVLSRFYNSVPNKVYKNRMIELGIYHNEEDVAYPLHTPPPKELLERGLQTYIYNCIVQEYTFGKLQKTNMLISKTITSGYLFPKLVFFIKNNLGLGKRLSRKAAS